MCVWGGIYMGDHGSGECLSREVVSRSKVESLKPLGSWKNWFVGVDFLVLSDSKK